MHKNGCPNSVNASEDCNHGSNGYTNGIHLQYSKTALDVRQYVNSAVYIETNITDDDNLIPFKKSPSFESFVAETPRLPRNVKVKLCICLTNVKNCPVHFQNVKTENDDTTKLPVALNDTARSDTDSGIRRSGSLIEDDLRLSIPSLSSNNTAPNSRINIIETGKPKSTNRCVSTKSSDTVSDAEKERRYREWCTRKDTERRLLEQKESLMRQIEEKRKEIYLEKERENFRKWLANKKVEEEESRKEIEATMRKKKEEEDLKARQLEECKLNYQIWSRRKEEKILKNKIREKLIMLKAAEEKKKREECNRKAYELWLLRSKHRAKPAPMNQGLQSLRSSASAVTFINPKPWVRNIDLEPE